MLPPALRPPSPSSAPDAALFLVAGLGFRRMSRAASVHGGAAPVDHGGWGTERRGRRGVCCGEARVEAAPATVSLNRERGLRGALVLERVGPTRR